MKKLYTTLLVLGLLIAAPGAMLAQISSGKIYVGYAKFDDQIWEYDGLSLDHNAKVGCAILLTKEMIAPYAGGTVKGMRVGWDTSQMKGEYEGFIRTDFNSEDLSTGTATVRYSYSDSNPGWNTMTMTDYVIPDDVEQLVVGFTTSLKKDVCAIPTLYPHDVKNSCYLWVDGDNDAEGNPRWVDMCDRGILPILLIVEDTEGKFNYVPIVTSLTPDGVVITGEPSDCLMRLKNGGSQTIRSIEVTSRQGEQTYSKKVTLSKAVNSGITSSSFLVPFCCFESGDVELSITKVNDKEVANPTTYTLNIIGVPKDVAAKYTRRPLVEYFESENNYMSPRYYDEIVSQSLQGKRDKLTFVCQHMDDQFMTGDDDATLLALQLCDNDSASVSVPAMTIDRAMSTDNIIFQQNASSTPMFSVLYEPYGSEVLNAAMKHPTFVDVNVWGDVLYPSNNYLLNVHGEIAEGVMPEGETPRLTVYLMERNVHSDSQLFWTEKEKEEFMGEYTHVNVIREILADGVEIPSSGAFNWEKIYDDPDPTWRNEDIYFVAFVHRDGKKGGKFMHVFNSTQADLSYSESINTIDNNSAASTIYDLSGRKLPSLQGGDGGRLLPKGIYIQNGKKLVVK